MALRVLGDLRVPIRFVVPSTCLVLSRYMNTDHRSCIFYLQFAGIMEEVVDKDLRTATPSASLNFVDNSPTVDKHSKEDTNKRGDSTSKEAEVEKAKSAAQQPKKSESSVKEPAIPKSSTKKSSRFFSASYFSSGDEAEFAPSTVFSGLGMLVREHLLKVVVGMALLLAGYCLLSLSSSPN